MRRWKAGDRYEFNGITVAIYPGDKGPGDLVAKWWTGSRWLPIPMSFGQFLADFFSENEKVLAEQRGHWRFNGDTYYLRSLHEAVKRGWQVPAGRTAAQRTRIRRDGSAYRGSGGIAKGETE
jgi:hypothetical protein